MRLLFPWLVAIMIACTSCLTIRKRDFSTPAPVHKELKEYYIRTRIVIEYASAAVQNREGKDTGNMIIFAEHFNTIMRELKFTEKIFSPVNMKFHVTKVEYKLYGDRDPELLADATKYPNYMTIYFRLPRANKQFDGLSGAPYGGMHPYGILLAYIHQPWTLAHEVGHYFGLLHTFSKDDQCDDTPEEKFTGICVKIDGTLNCRNLMTYCLHRQKYVTQDQTERMKRFLRSRRRNTVISPAPTTPLLTIEDFKKFYEEVQVTAPNPTTQPSIIRYETPNSSKDNGW